MRQLIYELRCVSVDLPVVVLDGPGQLVKQGAIYIIFLLYLIQGSYLFLEKSFLIVIGGDNRGEGACREGEGEYSDEHEEDAEKFLFSVVRTDVAIAHSQDGCNSKVHWGDIKIHRAQISIIPLENPVLLIGEAVKPDEDPKAGSDVLQDHEGNKHQDYSLYADTDFKHLS